MKRNPMQSPESHARENDSAARENDSAIAVDSGAPESTANRHLMDAGNPAHWRRQQMETPCKRGTPMQAMTRLRITLIPGRRKRRRMEPSWTRGTPMAVSGRTTWR